MIIEIQDFSVTGCSYSIGSTNTKLHPTPFDCQNKCNKPCFEAAYLAENVNIAQAKRSQTAKFRPIGSHWLGSPIETVSDAPNCGVTHWQL